MLVRVTPVLTNGVVVGATTNYLGTPYWAVYNKKTTPKLTPISTNVTFNVYIDTVYTLTNLAYLHGESIQKNGEIKLGTTDQIRTLTLSNSTEQVRLSGYAHGRVVPVSLGKTASAPVVYSANFDWTGSGSGVLDSATNTPIIINGGVNRDLSGTAERVKMPLKST